MDDEERRQVYQGWVEAALRGTAKLFRLNEGASLPSKMASGFLLDHRPEGMTVVTARHSFGEEGSWFLEVDVAAERKKPLKIPLRASTRHEISPDHDVAWWDLDLDAIRRRLSGQPGLEGESPEVALLPPMVAPPRENAEYFFAAYTQPEAHEWVSRLRSPALHRTAAFEVGMTFDGIAEASGLYRFRLARQHQGHAYYEGASGAPIFDNDFSLVSMLVRGSAEEGVLFGLPLSSYSRQLGLSPTFAPDTNDTSSQP